MELSKRLFAVASLVTLGNRIADIGTDHAYIPIYLIEKKRSLSAIAMDVNKGPLERAEVHIEEAGLQDLIETRLSDGFEKLVPGEVDCAVIAGMGGGLVMKILSAYPNVTACLKECVLQPQSEIAKVRTFLLKEGFQFLEEDMVLDEGKYYPMMKVVPSKVKEASQDLSQWTETELRFGKLLLGEKHPVLHTFLEREYVLHKQILKSLEEKSGEKIEKRKRELKEDLYHIKKGLEYYAV